MAFTRKQTRGRAPYGELQQHRRTPEEVKKAAEKVRKEEAHMKAFKAEQDRRIEEYLAALKDGKKAPMPNLVTFRVPGSALGGGRRRTRHRKTRSTRRR
jgi:hypothetical protein